MGNMESDARREEREKEKRLERVARLHSKSEMGWGIRGVEAWK